MASLEENLFSNIKSCYNGDFFTKESISKCDQLCRNVLQHNFLILAISTLRLDHHTVLYKFIILLSGDINLHPGPIQTTTDIWKPLKNKGFHLVHLNVNSLLPKIDELRYIAKIINAAIIGITESKLDDTVLDSEVSISGYDLLRNYRNRNGGGVACYVRHDICYNRKVIFKDNIENILLFILYNAS